jgi:hypothetical protein
MGIKNRRKVIEGVACLDNFEVGTVRGAWYPNGTGFDLGKLPPEWHSKIRDLVDTPVYVIYSYATPIAWRTAGGPWVVPDVRYSGTTLHHMSLARQGMRAWDDKCDKAVTHL